MTAIKVRCVAHMIVICAIYGATFAKVEMMNGSCQQLYLTAWLLGRSPYTDGVYQVTVGGTTFPVYCDMSLYGGGWTLLLFGTMENRVAGQKWTRENIKRRNENNPGITSEFSILYRADSIKAQGTGNTFQYRIEGNGQEQLGGIWEAPSSYSFVSTNNNQTDVNLLKKIGDWDYSEDTEVHYSIRKRMPWLCQFEYVLLTTDDGVTVNNWWGALVANRYSHEYGLAPFVLSNGRRLEHIYYWLRESSTELVKQKNGIGDFLFTSYGTDQAVANYTYHVDSVYSEAECCAKCTLHPRCLSINFERSPSENGMHACEFNFVQVGRFASRAVTRKGFDLFELVVE